MPHFVEKGGLAVNADFMEILSKNHLDEAGLLMRLGGGTAVKEGRHRSTFRVEMEDGDRRRVFYLKRHFWPVREKIRYLLPWKKKEDAGNEWRNMILLKGLGFQTMTPVAYGTARRFGIPFSSLTLTEEIKGAERLDHHFRRRFAPPLSPAEAMKKRALIRRLASLAAEFHGCGLNHQDFYLCHFLFREEDGELFIVDIQRLHRSARISTHDRVKDLGQLAYSAVGTGVFTRTDLMRFAQAYFGLAELGPAEKGLIRKVLSKMQRIARHDRRLAERRAGRL